MDKQDYKPSESNEKSGKSWQKQKICLGPKKNQERTAEGADDNKNVEQDNQLDRRVESTKHVQSIKEVQVPRLQLDMTPLKEAKLPIIWVLGGPGSGKGTQCVKIVEKFGYTHISSGDLLRAEVASGSELGKACQAIMKTGSLVPSGVIMDLMKKAILEAVRTSKGYLIDGMPRELAQARMFEEEISPCTAVLSFDVPDSVLRDRLLERGKDSGRVDDQNEETIKNRLDTFHQISEPVIQEYSSKCTKIDANRPVDVVFADVEKFLQGLA